MSADTTTTTIATIAERLVGTPVTDTLTSAQVKAIVTATVNEIANAVLNKETVRLRHLGTFSSQVHASRKGVKPRDGTPYTIPEMRRAKFKGATDFRTKLKVLI